jgi:hypothetical protein
VDDAHFSFQGMGSLQHVVGNNVRHEGSHYSFQSSADPNPSYDNPEDDDSFNEITSCHLINPGDRTQRVQFQVPPTTVQLKELHQQQPRLLVVMVRSQPFMIHWTRIRM